MAANENRGISGDGESTETGERPVRLGLVGAGIFAQDAHAPSIQRLGKQFEVVAVYSRTAARATELAARFEGGAGNSVAVYTDLDAMLAAPDIDAVDIVLPIANMADAVARSLKAGKHVLSEKPIAHNCAAAEELIAIWKQRPDQVWMVGENWRYEEAFAAAGKLVREGAIGKPVLCQWTLHAPITDANKYFHTPWRRNESFPGGFLVDGGVHHAAAIRLVVGEVEEVSATLQQVRAELPPADTLSATLRFANGALGSYAVTYAAGAPWKSWLALTGTQGVLRVERSGLELTVGGETTIEEFDGFNGVEIELDAFAQAIRRGASHINTPEAGLADLSLVEAMLDSAEQGRAVKVKHTTG